jgi:DNA-directed RNA polymerase I, II, and III subunit RPABC2
MSYFDKHIDGDGDDDYNESEPNSPSDTDSEDEEVEVDEEIEGGDELEVEQDIEGGDDLESDIDDDDDADADDSDDENQKGGEGDSDLEDADQDAEELAKKSKKTKKIPAKNVYKKPADFVDDDDEDEDYDGEQYLQKFDQSINENYVLNFHPESILQNYDEILSMTKVVRDNNGIIIDKLHRTIPFLTKYEKARILGQRAKQINSGAYPFVKVPENVIDGYIIAELELKQKRIPFIIRRPLPNGGSEYWKIQDLEDITF